MVAFRRAIVIFVTGTLGYAGATVAQTAPGDPPGRVGRLAFVQGTVSFHDNEQTDWAPALLNTPVTTGDAIWTEPNAKSEISIAGTRLRMDSASQLDMLALDDTQTRMQLDQGRIDIKTFTYDAKQPYEIVTPRGTIALQQQGDYYVEAGTTEDPTRLGVRQGAAQIQTPNGQVLAVRAGEVGEISGDGSAPQLHTIQTAPPPMPASWAERDRQVVYDKPPQYLGSGVTGYEDLNYHGSWSNDPEYGQVWSARSVPAGWSPYSTGRWNYEQTYGWTWVDEQPWGFAPYHYGRWAQRNNRWFWVPPQREQRAVYAPALVAFVGGTELGAMIGQQNRAPVGWFPLGPREAYVPPYTNNRDYYRRLNVSARVQQQVMDDRWQRAQRREAIADDNRHQFALMNRRFATVVPAEDFARSRPVERVAIKVPADKIATAPVAFLSAPPSPTQSIRASRASDNDNRRDNVARPNDPRGNDRNARDNDRNGRDNVPDRANAPGMPSRLANMQAIKPEPEREKAPGPKFTPRSAVTANTAGSGTTAEPAKAGDPAKGGESAKAAEPAKVPLPQLAPRNASAPPPIKLEGERRPVQGQQATAPPKGPADADRPGSPPHPGDANRPEPRRPDQPGQANLPPVRDRNGQRPEPPRTGDAERNEPNRAEQPSRPAEAQRPEPPRPGQPDQSKLPPVRDRNDQRSEPPRSDGAQRNEPNRAEPPRGGQPPQPPKIAEPQRPTEPPRPPQAQATPQPPRPAEAQKPPQAAKPAEAPRPPQAGAPQPPHQATPPAPPPQRERETRAAPPPQQHQAPPQQQTRAPAPPPQVQHAPPPQQAQAPRPAPQPQVQHAPPPQQAQAPRPAPQQQQQQQQQAPRPAPPPQQAQAPQQQPKPQQNQQNNNNDKK